MVYKYIQSSLANINFKFDHINKRYNMLHTFINVSAIYIFLNLSCRCNQTVFQTKTYVMKCLPSMELCVILC